MTYELAGTAFSGGADILHTYKCGIPAAAGEQGSVGLSRNGMPDLKGKYKMPLSGYVFRYK